jgi:uncharacterized protein YjiS (DUF1127 family)
MSFTNTAKVPCRSTAISMVPLGLGCVFLAALKTVEVWYERSGQRRRLAQLDDHLLRDIGIDRLAAMEEISKPFWQE